MNLETESDGLRRLTLSRSERRLMEQCLRGACGSLDDAKFERIIGVAKDRMLELADICAAEEPPQRDEGAPQRDTEHDRCEVVLTGQQLNLLIACLLYLTDPTRGPGQWPSGIKASADEVEALRSSLLDAIGAAGKNHVAVNILCNISKELARKVEQADDAARRIVVLAVCKSVVAAFLPGDAIVLSALARLESGTYDYPEAIDGLGKHVDALDAAYFDAHDAKRDWEPLFAKARAAGSVACAFRRDARDAAIGALYEACAALGAKQVEAVVDRVLGLDTDN